MQASKVPARGKTVNDPQGKDRAETGKATKVMDAAPHRAAWLQAGTHGGRLPDAAWCNRAMKTQDLLDGLLQPLGFKRARSSGLTYLRTLGRSVHRIAGRKSRHGGPPERDIHFLWSKDGEEVLAGHGLSPVAPLKNTYWWPDLLSPGEAATLTAQVEQIALPFFHAQDSAFDAEAARARVFEALDRLQAATPPFVRDGHCWWRQRGPIIDMVDVEFLADEVFALAHASVWHTALAAGIDGPPPDRVTRVTALALNPDGPEAPPHTALGYLGPACEGVRPFDGAVLVARALDHFARVHSVDEVRALVQPIYRRMMDLG